MLKEEKCSKPKMKVLKIIATLVVLVMMVQLFPPIVLGVQTTNQVNAQTKEEGNEEQSNVLTNTEEQNSVLNSITEENVINTEEQTNELTDKPSNTIMTPNTEKEKQQVETIIPEEVETQIIGELKEKRTLNEKHFLLEDGSILLSKYPSNVHYKKEGKLLDINNSLTEAKEEDMATNSEASNENKAEDNKIYKNQENEFETQFAKKSNKNKLVTLKMSNQKIKWSLKNSSKVEAKIANAKEETKKINLKNISSSISYENILPNVDIQYHVISNQLKEDIVFKNKQAVGTELSFQYDVGNLQMEKLENGQIIISEENSESALLILDTPYMYDAQGNMSSKIEMKLTKEKNKKYTLTVIPDKEWLEAEERVYPITIDPTVQTSLNYNDIEDTYIFEGDTGYPDRGKAHILRVGSNNKMKNPTRSLMKFTLPQLEAGDQVIAAMLDICTYPDTSEWTPDSNNQRIFTAHKMTADWNSSTANWQNASGNYDTRITDYIKYKFDTNDQCKFYYFDITSIVKDWYVTGNNYGVMLKDYTETYNAPYTDAYFFSANVHDAYANGRPMVQIVYRNQTGLENYQTYHTQDVGRAGTAYTNDYNGNLVLVHEDTSTPRNKNASSHKACIQ